MVEEILKDCEERMRKSLEVFRRDLAGVRAGRATPSLLERVTVDYYGTPLPVTQLATVTAPEPNLLVVQPWDKGALPLIERAIARSDLGVNPASDGTVIRVALPRLTEERREEVVRQVRRRAEEERVAVRNVRRDAIDVIRSLEKEGEVSEDESRRAQDQVQRLTERFVGEVDSLLEAKEREIREV